MKTRAELLGIIGLEENARDQQIIDAFISMLRTKDPTEEESKEDIRVLDAYEELFVKKTELGRKCVALSSIYDELKKASPELDDTLSGFAKLKLRPDELERLAYNIRSLSGYQLLDRESCSYLVAHVNAQSDGMYNTEILKFIFEKLVNRAGLSLPHLEQCNLLHYSGLINAFKKLSGDPNDEDSWSPASQHLLTQERLNYLVTHASVANELADIIDQISKLELLQPTNEEFVLFLCQTQDKDYLNTMFEELSTLTKEEATQFLDQLQESYRLLGAVSKNSRSDSYDSDDSDDEPAETKTREANEFKIRLKGIISPEKDDPDDPSVSP